MRIFVVRFQPGAFCARVTISKAGQDCCRPCCCRLKHAQARCRDKGHRMDCPERPAGCGHHVVVAVEGAHSAFRPGLRRVRPRRKARSRAPAARPAPRRRCATPVRTLSSFRRCSATAVAALFRADVAPTHRALEAAHRLRQQLLGQPQHDVGEDHHESDGGEEHGIQRQ